eukprot:13563418-Alexandrium_andersonii.AAC.1
MIGRARASILPARLRSSSATPCPTSVAWLRRLRRVRKLPDFERWKRLIDVSRTLSSNRRSRSGGQAIAAQRLSLIHISEPTRLALI